MTWVSLTVGMSLLWVCLVSQWTSNPNPGGKDASKHKRVLIMVEAFLVIPSHLLEIMICDAAGGVDTEILCVAPTSLPVLSWLMKACQLPAQPLEQ